MGAADSVLMVVVLVVVAGGALYLVQSGALQGLGQNLGMGPGGAMDPGMGAMDPNMAIDPATGMPIDPTVAPPSFSAPPMATPVTPVSTTPVAPVSAKPTLNRCTSVRPGYVCRDNSGVSCYKGTSAQGRIAYVCCNQVSRPCTPAKLRNQFILYYRQSRAVQPAYQNMTVGEAAMKGLCASQSGIWNRAKQCCSACKLGGKVVACGGQVRKC